MTVKTNFWLRPFEKIAGFRALGWGVAGLIVSTGLNIASGWHYHRLLHFGPAPGDAWWQYAGEVLIVWLVPALLFYLGGILLSKSRVRPVDVLGTVAFAQLPLIGMNLLHLPRPMQQIKSIDPNLPVGEIVNQPGFAVGTALSLIGLVFLIWTLVWMYNALKVSCNLKGARLAILYIVAVFGGDILCGLLIRMLY